MRTKFKPWAEPYINEHPEVMLKIDEFPSDYQDINLEIGAGKGQFLLEMALENPSLKFIGIERNVTCAGFTAKKLVEAEVNNAKLVWGDARIYINSIPNGKVRRIFLNFSDPWPKKRHHKRRLTAPEFINEYYRILSNEGELIIKTDNKDLFDFSVEMLETSPFKLVNKTDNYLGDDPFDKQTEYELSFREEGLPIYRMILRK